MDIQLTAYFEVLSSWCFWSEATWVELKSRYSDRVEFNGLLARSFAKNTFILSANFGATLDSQPSPQDYFSLGGFLNLSGLHSGEISGPNYGIGRIIYC